MQERDPRPPRQRAVRPKRPIYWSALFVVLVSGLVSAVAIAKWEPVQALAVVNPIVALWIAMGRGFFGGEDGGSAAGAATANQHWETPDA